MRIRAIELCNVRRFSGRRARIEGIGDGITVLSEPNEFGKSTFFDALHALFFERHRSTKSAVKALQPHSGGAPEVEVEVELPDGRFAIRKRWLSRAMAEVRDASGRILARDDEAEAWIDRLTGEGLAGPSGLLWVRQGLLGLEPEGGSGPEKAERERNLTARRDLLSSVAGEIELMTGGRRMDQVMARLGAELDALATATGKPLTRGPWGQALAERAVLEAERDALAGRLQRLSSDLARRTDLIRRGKLLEDPGLALQEAEGLTRAEAALAAADAHAERLAQAARDLRLAEADLTNAEAGIAERSARLSRLEEAQRLLAAALLTAEAAEAALSEAREAEASRQTAARQAAAALAEVTAALERLRRRDLARAAAARAEDLRGNLSRAKDLRRDIEAAKAARAGIRATPELLSRLEAGLRLRDRIAAQIAARSAAFTLDYSGVTRVSREGEELAAGRHPIAGAMRLDLPGIGCLSLDPGQGEGTDLPRALLDAEAALASDLAKAGVASPEAAQAALREAERLEADIRSSEARFQDLAPRGIAQLQADLAQAEAAIGADQDSSIFIQNETVDGLSSDLDSRRDAAASAEAEAEAARLKVSRLAEARAGAQAEVQAAERAETAALADVGDPSGLGAEVQGLRDGLAGLIARKEETQAVLQGLQAGAPDLETARAGLARVRSAIEGRRREMADLREERIRLDGSVDALAAEGIEEHLSDIEGKIEAVSARAGRWEAEVRALSRLREALEMARSEARETYLAPVLRELEPLLSILHPGAGIAIDDQSLLPVALTRDGREERLEVLSGGTREQIAILTRLSFARLFSRNGQPAPVILDDALVHSDDERIEAMFTALHRIATDQQILVLTCRSRAFTALGGTRARVREEAL